MRFRSIGTLLCRLFHLIETGSKSFIHDRPKRPAQFGCNRPRPLNHIIIYRQRCSHDTIMASFRLMSRHHIRYEPVSVLVPRIQTTLTLSRPLCGE